VAETVTRQKERKEKLEDILVVDADVHVHESPKELAPYCDMPWRKALKSRPTTIARLSACFICSKANSSVSLPIK
jgi:hypothetical protein